MTGSTDGSVEFFKLSGAGNDFIALAEPEIEPSPEQIADWCRRGISLGADGVFVLRRIEGEETVPRVGMTHYNADGGLAELCFNGARCAARLAFHLGWADGEVDIATDAGVLRAVPSIAPGSVSIEAPVPTSTPRRRELTVAGEPAPIVTWHLVVGVPHLVVLVEEPLDALDISRLGPSLRRHPELGTPGANVNFVSIPNDAVLAVRTWERGVEGETLACGSGIVASARVALELGAVSLPLEVRTAGRRPLRLDGVVEDGVPRRWHLEGDARVVAEGRLTAESR